MSNRLYLAVALACGWGVVSAGGQTLDNISKVIRYAQERSVKIYGAGGLQQLEAYQSGVLVSADGHIATMASVVLDEDSVTVLLNNGQRLTGDVVGIDPLTDVALLKLDAEDNGFSHFDLAEQGNAYEAMRVLAFSNLYNIATGDEPVSVQHGVLTAIAPLEARRGAFATRYRDDVYIVDAAINNPGAAGGVLVDMRGQPLGIIGKELRSELTGAWLNYALPWERVAEGVRRVRNGDLGAPPDPAAELPERPATFASLGFRLVPSVVTRTPPYIDVVAPNSPAAVAMLQPDDLVIAIGGMRTGTHAEVKDALLRLPVEDPVRVTLLRGTTLVDVELAPSAGGRP